MSEKLIAADIQKRFLFEISFEGQHYCGWQRQAAELEKNYKVSVQACLEKALKTLFSLRLEPKIRGCGRTDSGVHAQRYFFHVDLPVRDFREH